MNEQTASPDDLSSNTERFLKSSTVFAMWHVGNWKEVLSGPSGPDFAIDSEDRHSIHVTMAASQSLQRSKRNTHNTLPKGNTLGEGG